MGAPGRYRGCSFTLLFRIGGAGDAPDGEVLPTDTPVYTRRICRDRHEARRPRARQHAADSVADQLSMNAWSSDTSIATSAAAGIGRIWATPVPAHNDR